MDGATNGQDAVSSGRFCELLHSAERAAEDVAEKLALDVVAYDRTGSSLYLKRIKGLPSRQHDWPEWCWDSWCCDVASSPYSDRELFAMREPFIAQAALTLDEAGFDCR